MPKYKLKALSVSGLGNRIHTIEEGKILTDAHFPEGRASELVEQGFLVIVDDEGSSVKKEAAVVAKPGSAPEKKTPLTAKPAETKKVPASKDPTKPLEFESVKYDELKQFLTKKGVSFKSNESRVDLYTKYLNTFVPDEPNADEDKEPKLEEEINVAELEEYLTAKGIAFTAQEEKSALYEKYLTSFE